ncbi:hypothetical protein JCM10450v2_003080 [Rhodotorula kratochvilovae]
MVVLLQLYKSISLWFLHHALTITPKTDDGDYSNVFLVTIHAAFVMSTLVFSLAIIVDDFRSVPLNTMSTNESLSNKVGNATHGAVGDETILHQATHLASATVDYAKGVVGLGKDKGAQSADDAAHAQHGAESHHTLGELINEARDLSANVLHAASGVIGTGAAKAEAAAGDAQKSVDAGAAKGYVAQARDLAAGVLQQAEGLIAAGEKKVEETDLKGKADQAAASLNQKVEESKASAADASQSAESYAAAVKEDTKESTAQLGSDLQKRTA